MRFMVMHKVDAKMEAGERPAQELTQNMGKLIGRSLKAGIFKDGAGLHRSASRARVTFTSGKAKVERGPYAGANELTAHFAMISTTGIERAIELAIQLGETAGNREVEVGPVVEGWDLNGSPRPADAPHRFLLIVKGDADYEANEPERPAVAALLEEWKRDGLLQLEVNLKPSTAALRYKSEGGKRHWLDGPFTESKELIAGFCILELSGLDDAKRFTEEYAGILGNNEVDIRPLVD